MRAAGGIDEDMAPEIGADKIVAVAGDTLQQMADGALHAAHHAAEGEIAPALEYELLPLPAHCRLHQYNAFEALPCVIFEEQAIRQTPV